MSKFNHPFGKGATTLEVWLDRYLGILLVWLASVFRPRRSLPGRIERIALLKGDGMGDMVLLSGPLRDLRTAYPDAQISIWAGASAYPLARELKAMAEVQLLDCRQPWRAARALAGWKPQVVIDAGQWTRTEALIATQLHSGFSVGFKSRNQHRHFCYDAIVEHRGDCHELDNFRALLRPLGVNSSSASLLDVTLEETSGEPYLVFHLWPSGATHVHLKEWPSGYWKVLANACIDRGYRIMLTGGKLDVERTREWIGASGLGDGVENKAGVALHETITILKGAHAVVSVNTGVMHLAAALGRPTIGLHGPTDVKRWGAVGRRVVNLQVPPPEGGYLHLGFDYPADAESRPGMSTLTVNEVLAALEVLWSDCKQIATGSRRELAYA